MREFYHQLGPTMVLIPRFIGGKLQLGPWHRIGVDRDYYRYHHYILMPYIAHPWPCSTTTYISLYNIWDEVETCDKIFSNETVCILTKTAHQVYDIILILCQVLLHAHKVEDRKTRWRSSDDDGLVYIEAAEGLCGQNILSNFSICCTVPTESGEHA